MDILSYQCFQHLFWSSGRNFYFYFPDTSPTSPLLFLKDSLYYSSFLNSPQSCIYFNWQHQLIYSSYSHLRQIILNVFSFSHQDPVPFSKCTNGPAWRFDKPKVLSILHVLILFLPCYLFIHQVFIWVTESWLKQKLKAYNRSSCPKRNNYLAFLHTKFAYRICKCLAWLVWKRVVGLSTLNTFPYLKAI